MTATAIVFPWLPRTVPWWVPWLAITALSGLAPFALSWAFGSKRPPPPPPLPRETLSDAPKLVRTVLIGKFEPFVAEAMPPVSPIPTPTPPLQPAPPPIVEPPPPVAKVATASPRRPPRPALVRLCERRGQKPEPTQRGGWRCR